MLTILFIIRRRHIDAALIYGNQDEVGQGIKNSGVPREDIFLVSKASLSNRFVPKTWHTG